MIEEYKAEQWLPVSVEKAWDFFSSPKNLSVITPPELDFRILHPTDEETYEGMLIDYKVRPLLGISLYWQTKITAVDKPRSFTDEQLKGPYALWQHTHQFEPLNGGVLMKDRVRYRLPLGFIGSIMNRLLVKKKIEGIFAFRRQKLESLFPDQKPGQSQAGR